MPVPIGTGIGVSGAGLAGGAHPENIRLMVGDGESVAVRHPGRPQVHPAGVDLDDPATALANQMVMVHGIAEAEQRLAGFAPELRVRRNYPYAGKGDGLISHLRLRFAPCDYVGIELEVNQGIVTAAGRRWTALRRLLIDSLRTACAA